MKILKILETVKNFIKKNKKLVTVVSAMFCAVVLVAGSIAGTIAYLTSQATVTNTFTVGNVTITLDECVVTDVYGTSGSTRGNAGNTYKLIPGHSYTKDPTIHVQANSEDCYVFVKIENNIAAIEASGNTSIAAQLTANGWTAVSGETNVYCKANKIPSNNAVTDVVVFESFKIADNADVSTYAGKTIVVTAYAVQADGFASAEAAWNATFGAYQDLT